MHLITHILGRQVVLKDTSRSTLERSHINMIIAISNMHTNMVLCIIGEYTRVKYFINVICVINSLLLKVILPGIGGFTPQRNHTIVILAKNSLGRTVLLPIIGRSTLERSLFNENQSCSATAIISKYEKNILVFFSFKRLFTNHFIVDFIKYHHKFFF